MRKSIINAILGGALGGMLSYMGYTIATWEFWAVVLIATAAMINSLID